MAGTDLFTHIRYMLYTTVPSLVISLILFTVIGLRYSNGALNAEEIAVVQNLIAETFNVTPWVFLVPRSHCTYFSKDRCTGRYFRGYTWGLVMALLFQGNLLLTVAVNFHCMKRLCAVYMVIFLF